LTDSAKSSNLGRTTHGPGEKKKKGLPCNRGTIETTSNWSQVTTGRQNFIGKWDPRTRKRNRSTGEETKEGVGNWNSGEGEKAAYLPDTKRHLGGWFGEELRS